MKKTLSLCILLFAFCILLTACSDKCEQHVYDDCADTECNVCAETRDSMHTWNEADCTTAKKCSVCGATEGSALGHDWTPATCTAYEACKRCGAVKGGDLLAHSYTSVGYDDNYHYQTCSVCEKTDENSKEKHVLNEEYTCECGVEYTVKQEGKIQTSALVELYNSDDLLIKEIIYEQGEVVFLSENYYNKNGDIIKEEYYYDGELSDYSLYEYNENGVLLKDCWYDCYGELLTYTLYLCDENGNLTKGETFESDGTLSSYQLYEYDENGNLAKNEEYFADGTLDDVETYEYDENDNLIKEKHDEYNEDGAWDYTNIIVYNENGECIREEYAYSNGYKDAFEYDVDGYVVKETHTQPDGLEYTMRYEYDANKNRVKEFYESSDGYEYVNEYEHDESGNIIKEALTTSEDYERVMEYEYNENGSCVKESYKDSYGVEHITEYEYDENGNEIKSIKKYYDDEGNVIDVETEELEHDFSLDWQSDERGHWHGCKTEGCREVDEIIEHEDKNADIKCDVCSYEFGYVYDTDTESYKVYTESGLQTVLALGGTIVLSVDIELTDLLIISNEVILDLNGKAITISDSFSAGCVISVDNGTLTVTDGLGGGRIETNTDQIIYVSKNGELVINGGSIASCGYTIYVDGAVTVNGGNISYIFVGGNYGDVFVTITGGTILRLNLPSSSVTTITGGAFGDNPSEYLSNEYFTTYDETTLMWTVTAK